jgi:ABC-2 type transport system permease protein
MIRLVGSELFKLRTTRTFFGLAGGAIGLVLVITLLGTLLDSGTPKLSDVMMVAYFAQLLAVVIGVLCVTSEFRHGTITPSLLVAPKRAQLMLAKLIATVITTLALGLIVTLLITLIVAATGGETDDALKLIAGGTLLTALYAALGVGLGAVIRNQVGAIIGVIIYLLLLENLIGLIPGVKKVIPEYGITGSAGALSLTDPGNPDLLGQVPGGLVLTAYVAVFMIAGLVMMHKRDITA